jgi:hypothetical protein
MKKVSLQLAKEFWVPFLAALLWTAYNIWGAPQAARTLNVAINTFGATFFFASWFISQIFRVRKQQKVEGGLSVIEASVKKTLDELEEKTADLVAHITGGESFCYLRGMPSHDGVSIDMLLIHEGKHTLRDVDARIVDLQEFETSTERPTLENIWGDNRQFGTLIPGHVLTIRGNKLSLGIGLSRAFNIFFTASNGSFTQLLRYRKVGDEWRYATKVHRNDIDIYEKIQEGFPLSAAGQVEWEHEKVILQV